MAHWLTCKLTGRHDYSVWCEDGSMFLRCSNCGRRSAGWQVSTKSAAGAPGRAASSKPRTAPRAARLSIVRGD